MYRSLLYRNFLSKKDNAMALMKPAEGMGRGRKNSTPFPPNPSSLSKPATQASTDVQGTTP